MAVKYYCDACGKQLRPSDHNRLKVRWKDFVLEIITGWKGTWNAGNICHACVKRAVQEGKPTR